MAETQNNANENIDILTDEDNNYENFENDDPTTMQVPEKRKKWWQYILNFHVFFAVFSLFIIVTLILFFKNWGVEIDQDYIDKNGVFDDGRDTFDVYAPLLDENGKVLANKSPHTVLFFGNSPFADDRDSENNVVNLVAKKTGATVYNCSVAKSYLTATSKTLKYSISGQDVYNFYWLCIYLTWDEELDYFDWLEENPEATIFPETAELRHTLETVDVNTIDTICIMYDGSDYLAGHKYTNPDNPTDIRSFTGNLQAGIEVLRERCPHIRIIVMSPTYAFGVDDDGNYVSSDIMVYPGGETLSTYVLKECETVGSQGLTFIDNLYGTFNEDEASEYLIDNLHLNQKGREKLATRISSAITHYDEN